MLHIYGNQSAKRLWSAETIGPKEVTPFRSSSLYIRFGASGTDKEENLSTRLRTDTSTVVRFEIIHNPSSRAERFVETIIIGKTNQLLLLLLYAEVDTNTQNLKHIL